MHFHPDHSLDRELLEFAKLPDSHQFGVFGPQLPDRGQLPKFCPLQPITWLSKPNLHLFVRSVRQVIVWWFGLDMDCISGIEFGWDLWTF